MLTIEKIIPNFINKIKIPNPLGIAILMSNLSKKEYVNQQAEQSNPTIEDSMGKRSYFSVCNTSY